MFGFQLDNPLGLAAGFDKNGDIVDHVQKYGFSYVEVGSITLLGSTGNKKPRLFRLREDQSILNRMGLNGPPAIEIIAKVIPFHLFLKKSKIVLVPAV